MRTVALVSSGLKALGVERSMVALTSIGSGSLKMM